MRVLKGILKAAIGLAVLGGLALGAYLLVIREDEPDTEFRFVSALGADGETVACLFSDRRPDVLILETDEEDFGMRGQTRIAVRGPAGLTVAGGCDGVEPELAVASLRMMLRGPVPVITNRTQEPSERQADESEGRKGGQGKGRQGEGRRGGARQGGGRQGGGPAD